MNLNDFCHAVDTRKYRRAGLGCANLSSQGILTRDVAVADGWEMVLKIGADNGWAAEVRWELYADSQIMDPLHHATDEQLILLMGLGVGIGDLHEALMDAAPRLVATYDGGMDDLPRTESERLHRIHRAIAGMEEQIAAWYKPLARVEREEAAPDLLERAFFPGLTEDLASLTIRAS